MVSDFELRDGQIQAYQDHVCGVGESIEVNEFFDLAGQGKEGGAHDVGKVGCKGLHVVTWLGY